MTGLRVELRRSPALLATPILLILGVAAARNVVSSWTLWNNFSQGIAASLQLMGPAAAAVSAAAGLRARRNGTRDTEQLSARGPQSVIFAELTALLVWILATLVVLAATLAALTALHAEWGRPSLSWLLETFAALAGHVVLGYVAGRLLPYMLTPLVVAGLVYLANAVLLARPDRWSYFLSLLNVQLWLPFDSLNSRALLWQTLWLLGVSAILIALALARAKAAERSTATWALGGVAIAMTSALFLHADDRGFWTLNSKIEWTCQGSMPELCLHPAFSSSRGALTADFSAVYQRLRNTPFAFDRIEQRPRGLGSRPSRPTAVAFALDDPTQTNYADAVVGLAANALTAGEQCSPAVGTMPPSPESISLEQVVVAWASASSSVIPPGDPTVEHSQSWFSGLAETARQRWLTDHAGAVRRCTLSAADFR